MKIVIAIDHFKEGGAERVASVLANKLCSKHDVYTIVVNRGINYCIDERVNYVILPGEKSNKLFRIPLRLYGYIREFRKIKPDVIVSFANYTSVYSYVAYVLSGIKGCRFIASERTDPTREPKGKLGRLLRDWAYSKADKLVCQTEWVASFFQNKGTSNTVVIANPLTSSLPKWKGIESNRIITACRIEPQKNLPLLLSAFRLFHSSHPETELFIYGKGTLVDDLRQLCDVFDIAKNVHFPGFAKDIHSIMTTSYMYISSSDYEGISNSMLEALGVGMPTICTDCPVGGARMFIKHCKNGLLTKVGDVNDLFEKMDMLYSDKELALQCSKEARESMKEVSVDRIIDKWLHVIEK